MRRTRGLALAVVFSTALGVGATASIFSLVDAFLLRPLPVPGTSRVVRLASLTDSRSLGRFSYAEVDDVAREAQSFAGLATAKNALFGFARVRGEQPRVTFGVLVNGGFFSTLGVAPALGRALTADDDRTPGERAVVVISHAMWQREFAGRTDVLGQTIRLNQSEFTVVGVAPAWFTGVHPLLQPALYVPHTMMKEATGASRDALTNRADRTADVFARLKTGATIERARDEMRRIAAVMAEEHPASNRGRSAMVFSQVGFRIAEAPDNLTLSWLFFAVAGLVLAIACINVANLLLSTAPSRVRETAVRLAMGASRWQLLRQFLIESAALSTVGAIAGLGVAAACAAFIRSIAIASDLPLQLDARVDTRVALLALAVGVASGLLSGLLPAVRGSRADLSAVLKAGEARGTAPRGRLRQGLVVAQVAVALVMVILSGLFLEGIGAARRADPGYRVDHVLTMGFDPRIAQYDSDAARAFYRRLVERVQALPGARAAALGQHIPLGVSSSATEIAIAGYDAGPNARTISVGSSIVGGRYFEALRIPILRGRAFTPQDVASAPPVAIVNEAMAAKFWPARDPIGAAMTIQSSPPVTAQVVGIARTSKTRDISEPPQPFLYLPLEQRPETTMVLFVHTDGDPAAMAPAVRAEVRALDPNMPMYDVRTLASHFEHQALLGVRLVAEVVTAVGVVGLGLSVLGLYAVIAYAVSQRTREIGIRMAVGASAGRVLAMVLRQGLGLSAIGVAIGLALTLAISRVLGDLVDGVNPRDPVIYALGTALLLSITLAATCVPARRAATIDPQAALRAE